MHHAPAVRAVVVHHNNFDIISMTIKKLFLEGIKAEEMLIVDNSTEVDEFDVLTSLKDKGVEILRTENRGYGAAVNKGIEWWLEKSPETDFFLVATHEVAPEEGAINILLDEITADPNCGVVGPLLVTGEKGTTVWSSGGSHTAFLKRPFHSHHKVPRTHQDELEPAKFVDWVDGAFVLIRRTALGTDRFDEDFFMYIEEVHLQMKLTQKGWSVKVVPSAVVWQSSGGTPPYFAVRNIRLLHQKMGRPGLGRLAGARGIVANLKTSIMARRIRPLKEAIRGYRAGKIDTLKEPDSTQIYKRFVLVNPLGGALAHYTETLRENLEASGSKVRTIGIDEPSISGRPRLVWLLTYWLALSQARNLAGPHGEVMSLWPTLGYWDMVFVRMLGGPSASVVVHDPEPLVRSLGNSSLERRIIRLFKLAKVILHSTTASTSYEKLDFDNERYLLPHPIRSPRSLPKVKLARPCVRVLGQFKSDRDLGALSQVARNLGSTADLEITGRGWPSIIGWSTDPRFVSETELDSLITGASVVVIPYAKFFQSGIAIRCAELGTPVVGPRGSSLGDLLGPDSSLLAARDEHDCWSRAVFYAVAEGQDEFITSVRNYHDRCILAWAEYALENTERP